MNILRLGVEVTSPDSVKILDGLVFTSCAFVTIKVDGVDLLKEAEFEGSAINFTELERSMTGSGRYLVFTCACGIAEDAGWDAIDVEHREDTVNWFFERETSFAFTFDANQYVTEIMEAYRHIQGLGSEIVLEPERVIYPPNEC